MKYDDLKECTRCGSDACYTQEVTKDINIELCYGCGFQSNSIIKKGNEFFNEQFETLPELYKELMDEEEDTGKIWMPTIINLKDQGMVFADGSGRGNWKWAGVKVTEVLEEEKEKFKGQKYKPDMSTLKHFGERDFIEALSYIGVLPE
jgi:hypothetical protein